MTTKTQEIVLGDMTVDVIQKDIKNVHLSVHPPTGRVRISAPLHMDMETIRVYAISKISWIRRHQKKLQSQPREAPRDYIDRESHYYMGKRYLLKVIEQDAPPKAIDKHDTIELYVRPNTGTAKRKSILDGWYRRRLKEIIPEMIAAWEKKMDVKVADYGVKKMRTRWGTCNIEAKRIWLNFELAKKPRNCLEFILVHEMTHLIERNHNERFVAYMDKHLPQWRSYKDELNKFPVSHIDWNY